MTDALVKTKEKFTKNAFEAILISSVSNIIYLTGYSGFSKDEREAYLLIVAQPQRLTHKTSEVLGYILTDGRYSQAVKALIPDFELIEISSKLSFEKALKEIIRKHKIKKLGFEGHNISFMEHKRLLKYFNNIYHLSISNLRSVKTPEEISKIEKACKLGDKTFDYILRKIKLGVSEKELANEIEFFIKNQGAETSFRTIVAFGKNSAIPHHQTSDKRLTTKDKFVLLDFGVKLNNYCSDMTRTVFFGKPTDEQNRMHETVLTAQQKALEHLGRWRGNDLDSSEVDRIARDYILSKGYPTIPHSVGHGIGIDVHESPWLSPKSKDILKKNMVFSIEPGIYLPAEASAKAGVPVGGVRIEDLVVLEKNKVRLLTHSPKTLIVL